MWANFALEKPTRRGPFYLSVVARIAGEEVLKQQAQDRLSRLVAPVLRERYGVTEPWRYELRPLKDVIVGDVQPTLRLLFAAVGLTLLIGVLNFSGLLLARGMARRRELSVRAGAALGLFRRLAAGVVPRIAEATRIRAALRAWPSDCSRRATSVRCASPCSAAAHSSPRTAMGRRPWR